MKRCAIATMATVLALSLAGVALAQKSGRGLAKITIDGHTVSIDYGRPVLRGRKVSELLKGPLQPGHGFWRLGANSSTTYKADAAMKFGDVTIPAGTYSLWAQRQSDNSWRLVFNKQHGQWGLTHNPKLDFAFIALKQTTISSDDPTFTITLTKHGNGGLFVAHWGDFEVSTPFRAS